MSQPKLVWDQRLEQPVRRNYSRRERDAYVDGLVAGFLSCIFAIFSIGGVLVATGVRW